MKPQLHRTIRLPLTKQQPGVGLLEFAIAIPVLLGMIFAFVNLLVPIVRESWQWSAATQLVNKLKNAPILATVANNPQNLPEIVLRPLNLFELTSTNANTLGYLPRVNSLLLEALQGAGSGSNLLTHNVASRLLYFDICPTVGSVTPHPNECRRNGLPSAELAGHAYRRAGALNNPTVANDQRFFTTSGGGTSCFGNTTAAAAELDAFLAPRIAKIYQVFDTPTPQNLPPIATMTIDPALAPPGAYNRWLPVLAIYVCSQGGQPLNPNGSSKTMFLLFPGKEISFL